MEARGVARVPFVAVDGDDRRVRAVDSLLAGQLRGPDVQENHAHAAHERWGRGALKVKKRTRDDFSDFSAEIWPLRGGNTPKEKEAPVSVAIPRGATRGRSSPARGRHGQHGACARPISRPDRGRHGRATRPRTMSHLDARLNLARKSQILTRDLSLPVVPVPRRKTSATASSWSGSTPTRASP